MHDEQRIVLILGMHRSGTSMLAGTLQEAGVALGEVTTNSPSNPQKGNRENLAIMYMQEDLLKHNGGSWDAPPRTVRWLRLHMAVRDLFISGFRNESIWGFKDPRTLLTLDGWVEVLPKAEFVGIFRHPARVALSLRRRDRLTIRKGLKLWQLYNQRLLLLHKDRPFPLIEFHDDAELVRQSLHKLIGSLDLPFGHRNLTFFEDSFRHTGEISSGMPRKTLRLYDELKERTISLENDS